MRGKSSMWLAGVLFLALLAVLLAVRPEDSAPASGERAAAPEPSAAEEVELHVTIRGPHEGSASTPAGRATASPIPPWRVRVVDAAGQPAPGVAVDLLESSVWTPDEWSAVGRAVSGADGIASFGERDWSVRRARADVPSRVPVEVAVHEPAEPVLLQLPPTGRVVVEVVDTEGVRLTEPAQVTVWPRPETAGGWARSLAVAAPGGRAVLPHVEVGLVLRVTVSPESGRRARARVDVPGPVQNGEEVVVAVPLGPEWPSVRARVIDQDGNALIGATLEGSLVSARLGESEGPATAQSVEAVTDANGVVRVRVIGRVPHGYTRTLTLSHRETSREAEIDLSWNLEPGSETDLGDVVLRTRSRSNADVDWVEGRVVSAGFAVPDAVVLVAAGERGDQGTLRARADADGHFAVSGPPVAGPLKVTAIAPGFVRGEQDRVPIGARGVELWLWPSARWAGRVLVDPAIPREALVARLVGADGIHGADLRSEWVEVGGLLAGDVTLEVRTRRGDWLVEEVDGLRATTDDAPPDGRVDPLDLRERLALLQLRLFGEDGRPLDRVLAEVTPTPWPEADVWIEDGWLVLVVSSATTSISVRPRGHRALEVELSSEVQELHCSPL